MDTNLFDVILFGFDCCGAVTLASLSMTTILLCATPFFIFVVSVPLFGRGVALSGVLTIVVTFLNYFFISNTFMGNRNVANATLF